MSFNSVTPANLANRRKIVAEPRCCFVKPCIEKFIRKFVAAKRPRNRRVATTARFKLELLNVGS